MQSGLQTKAERDFSCLEFESDLNGQEDNTGSTEGSTSKARCEVSRCSKASAKECCCLRQASARAAAAKVPTVTLKQLAVKFGETHNLPTTEAQTMLDGVIGLLADRLKAGDKLRLTGLGILEVKDRPARTGRNPATGETIHIAASKKIAFRPAKELKDAI